MAGPEQRIAHMLSELGLAVRVAADGVWVSVPCARRGTIAVRIVAAERTVTMRAFVMRAPDVAHQEVYRRLLRKNDAGGVWAFSLDPLGDVFLVAHRPAADLDAVTLDGFLGALSSLVDETFEGLARTGFAIPPDVVLAPAPTER